MVDFFYKNEVLVLAVVGLVALVVLGLDLAVWRAG